MEKQLSNIIIEGARIGFRNFAGAAGQYNAAGNRNFCVFLEPIALGLKLQEDGWNVRWLKPRDEAEEEQPYIQVSVAFNQFPPTIMMITAHGKSLLDETNISTLDWAEIKNVDLIIRPYNWVMYEGKKNEKSGIKAYAKSMYVTLAEDEFEGKYLDVPDSAANSLKKYDGE